MKTEQQVPRNALVWMIISLFALVAPHTGRLPLWVLGVYLLAALWRTQVYRGQWSFPGRWVKVAMTLTAFAGIVFSYGSLLGLEPMVALLLTAFALKFIELASRKDAYVLLFLGYFICITEFLFTQDLLIVLYIFFNVLLVTTALVALHQPGHHEFNARSVRLAGVMLLQALPMMLVLFFLFPRIGPLWTVPLKSHTGTTGVSDYMKPGDISRLSKSDEVAFRVRFDGEIPPRSELYWRGLVFSQLRDGAWSSINYWKIPAAERRVQPVGTVGAGLGYEIIMEPTQQNWLFALDYAESGSPGVMQSADFRLFTPAVVESRYRYQAQSWPGSVLDETLTDWRRETELVLPPRGNARTRNLAQEMRATTASDRDFVQRVLEKFYLDPFVYTLEPPVLPATDSMDYFMFETRRGFCEHYAYAFVLMMRAAGLPARVVAGYQGGEVNPVNQTVVVRQFDAHAWAEVWLSGEGWQRVDPTAAVSPDRIEGGLEEALAAEGTFLAESPLSPLRYRGIGWINQLRLRYDALTYRWQSWVVGFDSESQIDLLQGVLGEVSARRFALLLLVTWGVVLAGVALSLLHRGRGSHTDPLNRLYLRACARLAKVGLPRAAGETPNDYLRRVSDARPDLAMDLSAITESYQIAAYAPGQSTDRGVALKRQVRKFRPAR